MKRFEILLNNNSNQTYTR